MIWWLLILAVIFLLIGLACVLSCDRWETQRGEPIPEIATAIGTLFVSGAIISLLIATNAITVSIS